MRDVTTAYHNANKADIRSSDFLIVEDTSFSLNCLSSAKGWSAKVLSYDSSNGKNISFYRCNVQTDENNSTDTYGYIEFSNFYNTIKDYSPKPSICIRFEDCFPTEIEYTVYDSNGNLKKTAVLENDSNRLVLTYASLLRNAGSSDNLYRIRFRFFSWSKQGVYPVILYATYGEPTVFAKDDLLSVNITLETDPTAQSIPYNSYECTIIDETDAYNPLLKDSRIYNFTPGQKFKFFNFEKGFNADDDEIITDNISLFDHEICPVGTAYFRDAKQQGTAVTFEFIDIVEKYDKITLSDEELMLSSHFEKRNVKKYLTKLFGNNLDTSEIPSDLTAITPFHTESKTQILLYMAQLMQKYVYVTTEGVFSFKEQSDFSLNNPFCIELAHSYQNPIIEKNYENNGVEVNAYDYSVSQNSELVLNRIEFLFATKDSDEWAVGAWSDGELIFDNESLPIVEIPKSTFQLFRLHYELNDFYDKDSLFTMAFGSAVPINKIEENMIKDFNFIGSITLPNGTEFTIFSLLEYCGTHINYTFTLEKEIATDYEYYDQILSYCLTPVIIMNELQGCKITSATNSVKRKKYTSDDSSPAVTIDNPLITDFETAKTVRDWMYTQINNSAFSIETDWRGDCSIELGDDITAEVAITQNGIKDYESRYIGTVVKNVIEYNGALKMQTTLFAPTQERWS